MTGLAGPVDVEQRALHVMVAHLHRPDAPARHVAVGARDARPRMDSLIVQLEFWMLRLERRRAADGVHEIAMSGRVVVRHDAVDDDPLRPRIDEPLLRAAEVVLDVTLSADEGAHVLAGRIAVHIVVVDALALSQGSDPLHETGTRDAQPHGAGIMAVDARYRMLHQGPRFA